MARGLLLLLLTLPACGTFQQALAPALPPDAGPMAYRSRVQTVLLQLDGLLGGVRDSSVRLGERLTRPLIALHGRLAWWQVWLDRIRELLTRSS